MRLYRKDHDYSNFFILFKNQTGTVTYNVIYIYPERLQINSCTDTVLKLKEDCHNYKSRYGGGGASEYMSRRIISS